MSLKLSYNDIQKFYTKEPKWYRIIAIQTTVGDGTPLNPFTKKEEVDNLPAMISDSIPYIVVKGSDTNRLLYVPSHFKIENLINDIRRYAKGYMISSPTVVEDKHVVEILSKIIKGVQLTR